MANFRAVPMQAQAESPTAPSIDDGIALLFVGHCEVYANAMLP